MSADLPPKPPNPQEMPRAIEVYSLLCSASLARTQMQQKCGEMSLRITEILGAAIAAMISAKASKSLGLSSEFIESLTFGLIILYALIQTLITANYIYHTFQVWIVDIQKDQLVPQVYEVMRVGVLQTKALRPLDWRVRAGLRFVRSCQPLIPAFSAIFGCVACLYYKSVWQSPSLSSWALFVIGSLFVFVLYGIPLKWLQEHMKELAVYDVRGGLCSDKSKDTGQTGEPSAPKVQA
jgi:hypothetical protein